MSWIDALPALRGRLLRNEPLAPFTWLRVGGAAEALFLPADVDDLATALARTPAEVPVTVLGVGSNVIVRDGGIEGLVVRLAGRAFGGVEVVGSNCLRAGAATLDAALARAAAAAGIGGLEFYAGIPGGIGGALAMNAGCYGAETSHVLVEAQGLDRQGQRQGFAVGMLDFAYRTSRAPADTIWISGTFRGRAEPRETIEARMSQITLRREASQPIREKTGGSTFKNPPGQSAWRLLDEGGWRGRALGGAMFSLQHANFLINTGEASAADLEALGEAARADVAQRSGIQLEWEIRRLGTPSPEWASRFKGGKRQGA